MTKTVRLLKLQNIIGINADSNLSVRKWVNVVYTYVYRVLQKPVVK